MIPRLLLALGLVVGGTAAADEPPTARAGGRALWVIPGEPDLAAETWLDLPLFRRDAGALVFRLDHRLTIEKPDTDFAFKVTDLRYLMQLGWSRPAPGPGHWWWGLGQRGRQRVDADGQAWVQFLSIGYETRHARLAVGPVIDERAVRAEAWFDARFHRALGRVAPRVTIEMDLEAEGLITGGRANADVLAGPRLVLEVPGGRAASFLLHYRRSRNPLGFDKDALILGFAYEERESSQHTGLAAGPEIGGRIQAGGGDGRLAGRFRTRFVSPSFRERYHVAFDLDGNILTADDTDELYYLYWLGIERTAEHGVVGVYYYHRSNHQLSEPNDRVTSINVIEAGFETAGWSDPGARVDERRVAVDGFARVGWLATSSFGEKRRWHARAAVRLRYSRAYAEIELERGDIGRDRYALGVAIGRALFLETDYRSDEQFFGRDRTATVTSVGYRF